MELSENGKELLKEYESERLQLYSDVIGVPTIGIGHALTARERASGKIDIKGETIAIYDGITEQQCRDLFDQDLQPFVDAVNKITTPLNQNQFDALVCCAFNIGVSAFLGSGMFRCAQAGDLAEVPDHLRQWNKAQGHIVRGLVNRRQKEISLWETPVSD